MRKIFIALGIGCLSLVPEIVFTCDKDVWENHWIKGLEHEKKEQYSLADKEYSIAIDMTNHEADENHIFIRVNRAQNHLTNHEYYKAIEEANMVIDSPNTLTKDRIEALIIRSRCYISLEMFSKFQEDYIWYTALDPNTAKFEYTDKYQIVRHMTHMSDHDYEMLYDKWLKMRLCDDISKIKRYDDVIIVELRKNVFPCACQEEEKKVYVPENLKEFKIVPHHGNGGRALDPDQAKILIQKQVEGCKWYCDNIALTCMALLQKYTPKGPIYNAGLGSIVVLKGKCIGCCDHNNGFFQGCVMALNDWAATWCDKPYMPEGLDW